MKAQLFLFALLFALVAHIGVLADDPNIQSVVENFSEQIKEIRKCIKNIIQLDDDIQKDLPATLNEKISAELKKHPVVVQTQRYLESSKKGNYLSTECETVYNSMYNSLKTVTYQEIYNKIVEYYSEIKQVITTRFEKDLQEFERRVNELYKSPEEVDSLTTKMNRATEVISNIETAQHDIIVKTLNYLKEEDFAQVIYDDLFVPFTECLNNAVIKN